MSSISILRAYQQSFESYPNRTLAATGGFLNALGDCVAQLSRNIFDRKEHENRVEYDFARTLRFFCFGFGLSCVYTCTSSDNNFNVIVVGPFLGRWNLFLEKAFPLRVAGKVSMKALGKRVACDQIIMAPTGLCIFIGSMGVMEGRSTAQIRQKYHDMFAPALISNWSVWPLIQLVNFRYMALPYRIPFQMTCGVFWTLYLSILNARCDDNLSVSSDAGLDHREDGQQDRAVAT